MYQPIKTIYSDHLELIRRNRGTYSPIDHSTLNEYFNVADNEETPAGEYPSSLYLAVGTGGLAHTIGNSAHTGTDTLEHDPTDASLYHYIPFVLRPLDSDLSPSERARYGMRALITLPSGERRFAYYLRRLEQISSQPYITVIDGTTREGTEYVPTPAQLNPVPQSLATSKANAASGKKISVESKSDITLSGEEINELLDVVDELFDGNRSYGIISEMGIVAGYAKTITTDLGGITVEYIEAVDATIQAHIPNSINIQFALNGVETDYRLGDIVPYLR